MSSFIISYGCYQRGNMFNHFVSLLEVEKEIDFLAEESGKIKVPSKAQRKNDSYSKSSVLESTNLESSHHVHASNHIDKQDFKGGK